LWSESAPQAIAIVSFGSKCPGLFGSAGRRWDGTRAAGAGKADAAIADARLTATLPVQA
jgi:hypothetical protein